MAEIKKMGYCVNGEWKESKAEKYMDVTDSSTGEVIAQVPCCTPDEVEEAIASAQAAFPEWSSLSLAKRQQYMFRWRDVLYAHKEELSVLCAKELGKNIKEARGDVQKAIEPTEEACALPTMIQGDAAMQVTTGYDTATYRKPLGVTAGIVGELPCNDPMGLDGSAFHRMWKYSSTESKLSDTADSYENHGAVLYRGWIPERCCKPCNMQPCRG